MEWAPSALNHNCSDRKKITCTMHYPPVNTLLGPSIEIKMKIRNPNTNRNNTKQKKPGTDNIQKPHITVPYQRGLSESFKRTCNNHGVQVHFKGGKTIKNLLMAPKDQDPIKNRSGVIYRFKCNRVECDDEYIGESSRTFGERFKEHLKAPSPVFDHFNITGHQVSLENFSIVGREEQNLMRAIKEALCSIHKGQQSIPE